MLEIKQIINEGKLHVTSYHKIGKAIIVDTNNGKKVIKKNPHQSIYDYLDSRAFSYYPEYRIIGNYIIMDYIDEVEMPKAQKISDLVKLVALLHNKTTYYQEVNEDYYKKIYEDIQKNLNDLDNYYHELIDLIDTKIYMSPSEYLLATNISKIFNSLLFCHQELDEWYQLVKDKKKQRYVVVHNNLELDHFLRSEDPYLISWDNAKTDIPVTDFYKLYKKHALQFDFDSLLKLYEKDYKLLDDERKLLFILISIPYIDKIDWSKKEYELCKKISNLLDYLYKTDTLISPYYSDNTVDNK